MNNKNFCFLLKLIFMVSLFTLLNLPVYGQNNKIQDYNLMEDNMTQTTGNISPKLGGTIQMLGVAERLKDDYRDDYRVYLFQKQARLHAGGRLDSIDYFALVALGGEEVPNNDAVVSLLDAYIDAPLFSNILRIRIGQFKVPYSREQLSDPDYLQFTDYSINTLGFDLRWDTGLALHGDLNNFSGAFGVFTGAGVDQPQRYLPEKFGIPLIAARFGYNTLDKDILNVRQFGTGSPGVALFASGLYEKDTRVGHSSSMSLRENNISLFYNRNWNPFLRAVSDSDVVIGHLWQTEVDLAVRSNVGAFTVNASGEVNYGRYENSLGSISMVGGVAQAGIYLAPVEIALRYAILRPDSTFGFFSSADGQVHHFISKTPIHEISPALTFYITPHLKITMDLQIWIDVPVAQEKGLGAYDLMYQPNQVNLAASSANKFERQNTLTGRMNLEFIF